MEQKKIKVAVLGCGNRARSVVGNLLRDSNQGVEIASVYDPNKKEARFVLEQWRQPDAAICDSAEEAINTPGVEWVMVFSPNAFHKEGILAGFKAGKHVFSEKPLATRIDDCLEVFEASKRTDKLFATGFVLRYSPIYRKARELLTNGTLGKLIALNADENLRPYHGSYIMCNWRRFTHIAGPHILEKCCHDLDLINWFCESLPSRAMAFGGRDFFVPENEKYRALFGDKTFKVWRDPAAVESPFTSGSDLMDNLVAILEFRNKIRVSFTTTMSNAIPERRMYFSCTEGTMVLDVYASRLRYKRIGEDSEHVIDYGADGHGGGDDFIMRELYDSMVCHTPPKCSGREGLESAVVALSIDRAACSGQVVDLEPVWAKLGR